MNARFGRLHRIPLVMNWRRRAREIVDLIDLQIERKRHVVTLQLKALVMQQMLNISTATAEKIVDANNVGSCRQQPLTQVRAQESRAACHQDPLFQMHLSYSLILNARASCFYRESIDVVQLM